MSDQCSVEMVESLKRKLNFSVSKQIVESKVDQELKKYAKKAKIDGFRPGKAPLNMIKQMYYGQAFEDALKEELNKKFASLVAENKFNIAGFPDFELVPNEGEDFIFDAVFEVMPEIKLGDLTNKEVNKPICNLTDKNIDNTIDAIRKRQAAYIDSQDAAGNDDKVVVDFCGLVDGVEIQGGKAEGYSFILGQGQMLADFEAGVLGARAGETREVKVNFPENYHAKDLNGKTADFTITVKSVAKQQLPELNSEFIKSLGIEDGSEESLRKELKENLERELERRLKLKARDAAFNALMEVTPLEVPSGLVHDEIHRMMENVEKNIKSQGYKSEPMNLTHEMFKKDAIKMTTLRLLVQEFIKENDIKPSEDDIKKVIVDMAALYEDPDTYLNWYYQDAERVNNARAIALEQKVVDEIFARALSKEIEITYEDVMSMQT